MVRMETMTMKFEWKTSSRRTEIEFFPRGEMPEMPEFFTGKWKSPFLVMDNAVRRLWDSRLQPAILSASGLYAMEAEEVLKNTFTLAQIWESMASAGAGRDTPVVVIGGGLVCDIGAMAASTYMRGLRLMLVPTTLLCMVDACLGGKTGVNMSGAKNQVGTFHTAERIVISTSFLDTLPEREFRSGLAEVIKTALIGDSTIQELLHGMEPGDASDQATLEMVRKCLRVKGGIVQDDLMESGRRMVLNLGHTVGHALESASGFQLSHGEAIGLGMLAESGLAVTRGGSRNLPGEIQHLLKSAGLPVGIDGGIPLLRLEEFFSKDKKTRREGRVWALPFDWCDCRLVRLTAEEEETALPGVLNLLRV